MSTSSSGDLGNIISRLQGLKNVSGRKKILPGAEFLENLEEETPDYTGTALAIPKLSNLNPQTKNLPEADLGGELTPQSYDVRANTINAKEPGFWANLGAALSKQISQPNSTIENERAPLPDWHQTALSNPNVQEWYKQLQSQHPDLQNIPLNNFMDQGMKEFAGGKGIGYDYKGAIENNVLPQLQSNGEYHWGSQNPLTGAYLKGEQHPTRKLAEEYAQNHPNENAVKEYAPPEEPISSPGFLGGVKDFFNPTKQKQWEQYNEDLMKDARLRGQGSSLAQENEKIQNIPINLTPEQISNPDFQMTFKEISGVDYTPEMQAQISETENAMKGVQDAINGNNEILDERSEAAKQRILNNEATDADKYYIGLALLMPALIGAIFGKEAGIGALGGGAQSISDILSKKQDDIRTDEQALLDINKQKTLNQEKLAKLSLALQKEKLPKGNKFFEGMKRFEVTNPQTGKKEEGVEFLPGLIAKKQYINDKESIKDFRKSADELAVEKSYVDSGNQVTDKILKIYNELEKAGNTNLFYKGILSTSGKVIPGLQSLLTKDVVVDGEKINSGTAIKQQLGLLTNIYGGEQKLGQTDRAMLSHVQTIIDNPTSTFLQLMDATNQILKVRERLQDSFVNKATNKGFYPEPLMMEYEKSNAPIRERENRKKEKKEIEELK